jgi:large subunit ribosomal protein L9
MKVLLLEDVHNLGLAGKVVSVADGYARNYLMPRKLAKAVDEGSVREIEQVRQAGERKRAREMSAAQLLAKQMEAVALKFQARAGETGKLYGSITPADIATALEQAVGQPVDRRKIECDPLRQLGDHEITVRLLADVSATVKVTIEPDTVTTPSPTA